MHQIAINILWCKPFCRSQNIIFICKENIIEAGEIGILSLKLSTDNISKGFIN